MEWYIWVFWVIGIAIFLSYSLVLLFGAPYLPTLSKQKSEALDMLALKPGQQFVDLGCGDGRLLVAAAERGLIVTGYEMNPFLFFYAWLRTRRYGRNVKVKLRNFWKADLSSADGVFVFLLDRFMTRLDKMLSKYSKDHQIKLVSHAFKIPGKRPIHTKGALLLYIYK